MLSFSLIIFIKLKEKKISEMNYSISAFLLVCINNPIFTVKSSFWCSAIFLASHILVITNSPHEAFSARKVEGTARKVE